jgi:hypothetical protein
MQTLRRSIYAKVSGSAEHGDSKIEVESTKVTQAKKPAPFSGKSRSEVMKARWQDPVWRAAVLAKRSTPEAVQKRSAAAKRKWQDPEFRERQHAARIGRQAWNEGVSPNEVTRVRMSYARRGVKKSDATKMRMSASKLDRPAGDTWPRLISKSKRGKSRQYWALRREFRALHHDLKSWSDNYRATTGRLPRASTYAVEVIAPMLAVKIKRYLVLKAGGFTAQDSGSSRAGYDIIIDDVREEDNDSVGGICCHPTFQY